MKASMIAPCGMNCNICMAHLRTKNVCDGCWSDNKPYHCTKCAIKHCELLEKTEAKFCYECQKFPCARLKRLDKRYREKYNISLTGNLIYIKINSLDEFIKLENDEWACNNCGKLICVHTGICSGCNQKIINID